MGTAVAFLSEKKESNFAPNLNLVIKDFSGVGPAPTLDGKKLHCFFFQTNLI